MAGKILVFGAIVVLFLVVGGFYLFRGGDESSNIGSSEVEGVGGVSGGVEESGGLGGGGNNEIVLDDISGGEEQDSEADEGSGWMEISLKEVSSGETFKVSDFRGKPVLLESFAVWCPTCTRQQREIKEFHEEVGDSVISISLDTDANEDEARILGHVQSNGFDWRYAVSPVEMTQGLINDFGVGIVNAPSAPVVLICADGSTRQLGSGVKKVDELKKEIAKC